MTPTGKGNSLSALATVALELAACSPRPLPEAGSEAAELYVRRCGSCHRAFDPAGMKDALWEMVLPRMEERMQSAGMPPLSNAEREMIRGYLKRNSG